MTTFTDDYARLHAFIQRLDLAVGRHGDPSVIVESVKKLLEGEANVVENLPSRYLETAPERYARRLLYKDPNDRFSVVVMVWNKGQGTPLHDHSGMWCVECVVMGRITVSQYDLVSALDAPLVVFKAAGRITAGFGEAGALIPPFEYHRIENVDDEPAATIHVYGGEMNRCSIFHPEAAGYRREYCSLHYTGE